jgi:hypothetical protein
MNSLTFGESQQAAEEELAKLSASYPHMHKKRPRSTMRTNELHGVADMESWSAIKDESDSSLGTMATDSTDPPDAAPVVLKATLSPAWCASLDILAAIQQKYFHIETNEFRGRTNGRTGQDEAMICRLFLEYSLEYSKAKE